IGRRRNVDLQLIPFTSRAYPGLDGSHLLLEFEKAPSIVHLENARSSLFLDDPEDLSWYLDAAATLHKSAYKPARALELIEQAAGQYEKRGGRGADSSAVAQVESQRLADRLR